MLKSFKILAVLLLVVMQANLFSGCATNASAKYDRQLEKAVELLAEYKFSEAEIAFKDIVKLAPERLEGYKGLAIALRMQKKMTESVQALQDAAAKSSNPNDAALALASLYMDMGDTDKAQAEVNALLQGDKVSAATYLGASGFFSEAGGDYASRVIEILKQAVEKYPENANLWAALSKAYAKGGAETSAMQAQAAVKALELDSAQFDIYNSLSDAYLAGLGKADIDSIRGQNQKLYGKLLNMLIMKKQAATAADYKALAAYYSSLTDEERENGIVKYIMASVYFKQKQQDKAFDLLDSMSFEKIKDIGLLGAMASLYQDADKLDMTEKIARMMIEIAPADISGYKLLSMSFSGKDEAELRAELYMYLIMTDAGVDNILNAFKGIGIDLMRKAEEAGKVEGAELPATEVVNLPRAYGNLWGYDVSHCYYDSKHDVVYVFLTPNFDNMSYYQDEDSQKVRLTVSVGGQSKSFSVPALNKSSKPYLLKYAHPEIFGYDGLASKVTHIELADAKYSKDKFTVIYAWYKNSDSDYREGSSSFPGRIVYSDDKPFEYYLQKAGKTGFTVVELN